MPQTTSNTIRSVKRYECGYCENQLAFVYRRHGFERRRFPSNVFLIHHPTAGYILFDTGYSASIYKSGWRGKLYNLFNPTFVKPSDEIAQKLTADGIDSDEIRYIILSHLHPDHVGGLKFFTKASIIVAEETLKTFRDPSPKDLIFPELFPDWFERNAQPLSSQQLTSTGDKHVRGYDLLGDGSLLITSLEGHTHGQLGAYIPGKLYLAADACWGIDLMDHARNMRSATRRINNDYQAYCRRLDELNLLEKQGVKLYFSHDTIKPKELLP